MKSEVCQEVFGLLFFLIWHLDFHSDGFRAFRNKNVSTVFWNVTPFSLTFRKNFLSSSSGSKIDHSKKAECGAATVWQEISCQFYLSRSFS
jgi:hypothetical protein